MARCLRPCGQPGVRNSAKKDRLRHVRPDRLDNVLNLRQQAPAAALSEAPPPAAAPRLHGYGGGRVNRTGLAVTVLLHVLLLATFLLRPKSKNPVPPPPGSGITYVSTAPPPKSAPRPVPEPPEVAPAKPSDAPERKQEMVKAERLPDTITVPAPEVAAPEPEPAKAAKPEAEPAKVAKPEPEMDMAAMVEARRRARGPVIDYEAERAKERVRANIAAANAGQRDAGPGEIDSAFRVSDRTFNTAQLKFDLHFVDANRRGMKQDRVDLGQWPDMETAIVKKMVEMLIEENFVEFVFTSRGKAVTLSTRPQFRAELEAVLLKEQFPKHTPARR